MFGTIAGNLVIHCGRVGRFAFRQSGLALVALTLAQGAISAEGDVLTESIPDGQWIHWAAAAFIDMSVEVTIFWGCLDSGTQHRITFGGGIVHSIPAGSASAGMFQMTIPSSPQAHSNFPNGLVSVNYSQVIVATLESLDAGTWQTVDTQPVTLRVQGTVSHAGGAAMKWPVTFRPIFSLKAGGPADGKTRVGQEFSKSSSVVVPTTTDIDMIYEAPSSYVNPETGSVVPLAPTGITYRGQTDILTPGIGWKRYTVLPEDVPGSSVPGFIASAFPRSHPVTGGPEGSRIVFGGGVGPQIDDAVVSTTPQGDTNLTLYTGDGLRAIAFPNGFQAYRKDFVPSAPSGGSDSTNVDPCFAYALDFLDLPPPGVGPEDPAGPGLPDGLLPGELPAVPGIDDGPVSLPPGMEPGVPGGPIVGNPGNPGQGPPGGGVGIPSPAPPDGEGPAQPGGPLPGDEGPGEAANAAAGKFRDAFGSVQDAAKGFMQFGRIVPFSAGQDTSWTIDLNIAGTVYAMEIPTFHAPLVRAVLKLVIAAMFLIAMVKLLLS